MSLPDGAAIAAAAITRIAGRAADAAGARLGFTDAERAAYASAALTALGIHGADVHTLALAAARQAGYRGPEA